MLVNFWDGFFKTLNFETKGIRAIQGASGIKHKILSFGINEEQKRIILVQDEQDARILAMVQADVQAKIKDYNILMVRPVSINLSTAFSSVALLFGTNKLTKADLQKFAKEGDNGDVEVIQDNKKQFEDIFQALNPQIEIIQKTKPNLVSVFKETVQQLSHLKFLGKLENEENFSIDFEEILNFNPIIYDTSLGICPIPLYNFTVEEAESFLNLNNNEANIGILEKHAIHQFFYPPPDSLALGLIENEKYSSQELIGKVTQVPDLGHPFGKNELTDIKNLNQIVDALKAKNLIVEGEFSMSITEEGKEKRMMVKFGPRESIFKRLSNIFSVKIDLDLKNLLK